ncbi:hypothetical protein ACONDI_02861 [Natranaerofaba carboxydovora]|nr:hypothetical protein ACONDI_02861 [Natranaerofaba carboxydovora]
MRDIFIFKIAQNEELLYGFDNIKEYSEYFSIEDIELIITKIEKAKQYLSSNVNRLLTFEGMLLEIKEVINNE